MPTRVDEAIADPKTFTTPGVYDEIFTAIRRDDPVRWTTPPDTRPFWMITKHADIMEVERQGEIFLSAPRTELLTITEERRIRAVTGNDNNARTMLHMDGEEHLAYRMLTQGWFAPRNLRKLEDDLRDLAREYVDRMAGRDGRCDFVADIASWYPLRVIMTIMGLPREDERELLRLTRNFVGRRDEAVVEERTADDAALGAAQEIFEYFGRVRQDRLASPRDDLSSIIANGKIDGKPMGELEALSYFLLVGTAGHETTTATISGGLLALIQNPDQMAKLKANPALVMSAIDEMLRWTTPTKHFFRTAARDYELRGKTIKAGEFLMMCYPSGNRDEEAFEDPFAFQVDRDPNPHLSFGHGPHVCLGQHLAKMEMRALFSEMVPRLDKLEMDGRPEWLGTVFAGGLKSLPIRYSMRETARVQG